MAIRKMSPDGERRYQLALRLCGGDKNKTGDAIAIALSTLNGLTPYESELEEHFIKNHLPKKLIAKLTYEESLAQLRFEKNPDLPT